MAFGRRRRNDRTATPTDLLVVGLGNPGDDYVGSRHNVGADTVQLLADRHGGRLRGGKNNALIDELRVDDSRVALAIPLTFYNESGLAVRALVRRHGIDDWSRIVVIHDEMDLETGRIKLKVGGGLAGNNGLKSITAHLHTQDYARIRIGIGKPPGRQAGKDHVLRRPGKAERAELDIAMQHAADAVEAILAGGMDSAMNLYNQT